VSPTWLRTCCERAQPFVPEAGREVVREQHLFLAVGAAAAVVGEMRDLDRASQLEEHIAHQVDGLREEKPKLCVVLFVRDEAALVEVQLEPALRKKIRGTSVAQAIHRENASFPRGFGTAAAGDAVGSARAESV